MRGRFIFKTACIGIPGSVLDQGYQGPAFVEVYQGRHKNCYELYPIMDSTRCQDPIGKLIAGPFDVAGSKQFAIGKAREMLADVESWPSYQ